MSSRERAEYRRNNQWREHDDHHYQEWLHQQGAYQNRNQRQHSQSNEFGNPRHEWMQEYGARPHGGMRNLPEKQYGAPPWENEESGSQRQQYSSGQQQYGQEQYGQRSDSPRHEEYHRFEGRQDRFGGGFYGDSDRFASRRESPAMQGFESDYYQWRDEQLRSLDNDYQKWRDERYQKFSEEFDNWRKNRAMASQSPSDDEKKNK